MKIVNNKQPIALFLGDLAIFYISIWLTLLIRYFEIPATDLFFIHLEPFSILFVFWILVIYIAGLYDRLNSVLWRHLPYILVKTQVINMVIAVIFFYFIPLFNITPKTVLFIYLFISLALLAVWRIFIYPLVIKKEKQKAFLIARGDEMKSLRDEINDGEYGYYFSEYINLDKVDQIDVQNDIVQKIYEGEEKVVVIDTQDDTVIPLLSHLYNLMFSKVNFVDMHEVYENVFGRIPLSLVKHGWFLKNVTTESYAVYDGVKRITDILASILILLITSPLYPFIFLAIGIDKGNGFIFTQDRVGQDNKKIKIYKFRSMAVDGGDSSSVTKVGNFLRKTRLDELPQLINVIKGDLSLIGPRPEKCDFVNLYSEEIPYYNVRHLIKPGLSGWAQVYHDNHPHHGADVDETRNKLSYDLYYVKNRSIFLDIKITLQTLGIVISRKGK